MVAGIGPGAALGLGLGLVALEVIGTPVTCPPGVCGVPCGGAITDGGRCNDTGEGFVSIIPG